MEELTELGVSLTEASVCTRMHERAGGGSVPASFCTGVPQTASGRAMQKENASVITRERLPHLLSENVRRPFLFQQTARLSPHINNISMTFTNSPACFLISRALH